MILFYFIVLTFFGDAVLGVKSPPGCHQNPGFPPRPPRRAGSSAVAVAYSSSSSSSSSSSTSHASSSSYASSSAVVSGPARCNDFDRCRHRNATYKKCPNPCPGTCENPEGVKNCLMMCKDFGCECNNGYVLSDNGNCILLEDCPDYLRCSGDRNATYKECPNPCPRTCKFPGGTGPCRKMCLKEGCECKEGFYFSEEGICVHLQDCPGARACSSNESFAFCNVGCPNNYCPVDDSRAIVACSPPFPCGSGCSCKGGYLRLRGNDRCILASDCPPVKCTRQNEEWNSCPPPCFSDRCSDLGQTSECDKRFFSCRPQCVCQPGFCRNDDDICIPVKKPPICGYNEMPVKCRTICPPQSCEIAYTEYACGNKTCEPGCDCLPDYLRNSTGICIPNEECPPPPCPVLQRCRPTCAVPNPPDCPFIQPAEINDDECNCQQGYILSEWGGQCIRIQDCPTDISCNGDPNAVVKECPLPCPSTCDSPNAFPCKRKCDPIGCECKSGYIRSENGCILPDDCPGGNPCGPNATFVPCKYICPTNYCPVDDSRTTPVCETYPFAPCFSGCMCRLNHRLLSRENPICIRSDECRPVNCTRPYEAWDPCPSDCKSDYCEEVDKPDTPCYTLLLNCNPQCRCTKGYYRNPKTDICVCADECRRINKRKLS